MVDSKPNNTQYFQLFVFFLLNQPDFYVIIDLTLVVIPLIINFIVQILTSTSTMTNETILIKLKSKAQIKLNNKKIRITKNRNYNKIEQTISSNSTLKSKQTK